MKTIDDRLLDMLLNYPRGVTIADARAFLGVQPDAVRKAFQRLDNDERAKMVRRKGGRALYLVSLDDPVRSCRNCYTEFEKKHKTLCCSRACGISWSWRQPGVAEKRKAGIREERKTERAKARLAYHNKRRWSNPEEHEKLSEQNRRLAKDPHFIARRATRIQAANSTPEKRKFYSDLRKRDWAKPEYREKMSKAMRAAMANPEERARRSHEMRQRWRDPVQRKKLTEANCSRNAARFHEPTEFQSRVLAFIRQHEGQDGLQISTPEIERRTGWKRGSVRAALKALERRGLLTQTKTRRTGAVVYQSIEREKLKAGILS